MNAEIMTFIISIISVSISLATIIYTMLSNRDRFIISSTERKNILEWYDKSINIIMLIREKIIVNEKADLPEILSELSAQIEIGRFYFPNIDLNDSYGNEKPEAYKGYRQSILTFLVFIYEIAHKDNPVRYLDHLNILQREFTSTLYKFLKPSNYVKKINKNSYLELQGEMDLKDFLNRENPSNFIFLDF